MSSGGQPTRRPLKGGADAVMTRGRAMALLVVLAVVLTACTAGANPEVGTAAAESDVVAGFWYGLWHGVIAPVTFVISLFSDAVNIYEVHNAGNWYDVGFMLWP